ncbi:MAG: UDP-N-acetylmuramate dehydrogenase [Candidatus Pacebacteria bacterium]|nr:UDP-N-acetylmuramate dehydrogenase [Candidatus Paceibacterota bacterium]
MQIEEHILLGPLTTFQIGGPARFFARVQSVDELKEAFTFAKEKNLKVFILGGGSNVLVDDAGFDGLVVKVELMGVEEGCTALVAAAGENWDALVAHAVDKNAWGIENLSGIPGTVGGAVVQNIGAYGQALSQTLAWVEVFDTQTSSVERLAKEKLNFGYRGSLFKQEEGRYVVLKAAFDLSPTPAPSVTYKDLAARFAGQTPSILDIRHAVLEIRANKFPDLLMEGTAGSFFKNPIVKEEEAKKLQETYPDLPTFAMPETSGVKVPLAWLFDHALNLRGTNVGGARLFEKQLLVIAAAKKTSSHDVRALAEKVSAEIKNKCNITIEPEVKIIV